MNPVRFAGFFSIPLLLLPVVAFAANNAECSFVAPTALLQPKAYQAYSFQAAAQNEAVESAEIAKGVHLEIRQSQCVDFITTRFIFSVKSTSIATGSRNPPLTFAIRELSHLKLVDAASMPNDLLAFLKSAAAKKSLTKNFSICKDGSTAPPGACSWDSLGGYIFEIKPEKERSTISVTVYISG